MAASVLAAVGGASASAVGVSPPGSNAHGQFGCGELGFLSSSSSRRVAFPAVRERRRSSSSSSSRRGRGVAIRPANSGTADENMVPDSAGPGDCNSVDANMLVLRRRIEGMRMKETFIQTPEEWMEWEKSWYSFYRADVNVLVAGLQAQLLGMRPSVVIFVISFFLAIVPVLAIFVISALSSQLFSMNNAVIDAIAPWSAPSPPT